MTIYYARMIFVSSATPEQLESIRVLLPGDQSLEATPGSDRVEINVVLDMDTDNISMALFVATMIAAPAYAVLGPIESVELLTERERLTRPGGPELVAKFREARARQEAADSHPECPDCGRPVLPADTRHVRCGDGRLRGSADDCPNC